MAEYIEREAAIAIIEEKQKELCPVGRYGRGYVYGSDREKYDAWDEIIDALENIPAADVVPVVRCMDCKHLMNGEAITRENVIANLKADADVLRNKLADTEAALGKANAEASRLTVVCRQVEEERDYMHQQWSNAEQRAIYAEAHPWRNLWAWVKRKLVRHE